MTGLLKQTKQMAFIPEKNIQVFVSTISNTRMCVFVCASIREGEWERRDYCVCVCVRLEILCLLCVQNDPWTKQDS